MSRLREFQRSTVSLEKSVFDDMLVRLEKLEQLEKKVRALELEILDSQEKAKAKEAAQLLFCSRQEFEEWGHQQGILVLEKHWSDFIFYTENNPLAYAILKSDWFEKWWNYECKREEEYQRELRLQAEQKEQEQEKEQETEQEKEEEMLTRSNNFVENGTSGATTE